VRRRRGTLGSREGAPGDPAPAPWLLGELPCPPPATSTPPTALARPGGSPELRCSLRIRGFRCYACSRSSMPTANFASFRGDCGAWGMGKLAIGFLWCQIVSRIPPCYFFFCRLAAQLESNLVLRPLWY
jgi:hypothetical protein